MIFLLRMVFLEHQQSTLHFCDVFNKMTVKHNIRLMRDTGAFVTCTICTAYHSRLRKVTNEEERKLLKSYRRSHLDKQRLQREKYYRNRKSDGFP
jgi:hypothetical protein